MLAKMISRASSLPLLLISMLVIVARADVFSSWDVTYGTLSPLGVSERVILINGQFPGLTLKAKSNETIFVNVFNKLDEPLLFNWKGVQLRRNPWLDGTAGTMCPIPPGTNYTYRFLMKDQIGTFMYFPTTNFQMASGGYGGFQIHNLPGIPIPFEVPEDDFTVMIGDWYSQDHVALRKSLDEGQSLGKPDGVLINGKRGKVGDESVEPIFTMIPGKTYRYRICNAGMRNSLNFRIQNHTMKLVEVEGVHVMQNVYDTLDVHLGQCFSVLVTADQNIGDYYMVASSRFTKYHLESIAKIRYEGGNGLASTVIPKPPGSWGWSFNQFGSMRCNLTANAAGPMPQGSYVYAKFDIRRTIKLVNTVGKANGKLRYAINGQSHVDADTPYLLAEWYGVTDKVFKYNTISDLPASNIDTIENVELDPIVIKGDYRNPVEIIFENHETGIQYWHMDGHSFFVVAMEVGEWSPDRRKNYNMLDAVNRYSIQVYPKSWVAVVLNLDNQGMWNIRSESLEKSYLGQQMYLSVIADEGSVGDENNVPEFNRTCGIIKEMPSRPPKYLRMPIVHV